MNAKQLCRQNHPAEWDAPIPRRNPCADCTAKAQAIVNRQIQVIAPRPRPEVVVICGQCGGQGRRHA